MTGVKSELVDKLVEELSQRGETLAAAESCTGGLLAASLVEKPGVSCFFVGSIVAYSNQVKRELLDVPSSLIRTLGAVSQPVALKMAQGVRKRMNTCWSVAITGTAGPDGGTLSTPVGTVCFAVCGPGIERTDQRTFEGTRQAIQVASVEHATSLLLKQLNN